MPELDNQELDIIGQCLKAIVYGPFLIDKSADDPWWEFHTLMGLTPNAFADIADSWPEVDLGNRDVQLAINNAMNSLLGYPHRCETEWPQYISVPAAEVARVLDRWRSITSHADGQ